MFKKFDESEKDLCIEVEDYYSYDFSKPPPLNRSVKLHVNLDSLFQTCNDDQKHSLLLLAEEFYDPYTNTLILSRNTEALEQSSELEFDRHQNILKLVEQLHLLVKKAKV